MRTALLFLGLLISGQSYAQNFDQHSLTINGSEQEENFSLRTSRNKTVYENQSVANTCHRDVQAGFRRNCYQHPQTVCREVYVPARRPPGGYGMPIPGGYQRVCDTFIENQCHNVPNYVRESYTCYENIRVAKQVFNGQVTSNINVKIKNNTNLNLSGNDQCSLNFQQNEESFDINSRCDDFIILKNKELNVKNYSGENVIYNRSVDITLLESKQILAPVNQGISELRLDGQNLVFRTGNLNRNKNYEMILKIQKKNLLKKDEDLVNRNIAPGEYTFSENDLESGVVRINLDRMMGGVDASKKHEITVTIRVLDDLSKAMNINNQKLEVTRQITVKK